MRSIGVLGLMSALVLGSGLLVSGCGYSTRRLEAFTRARTVAVSPFTNLTYLPYMGVRLTRAVVDELRARTNYGISSPEAADLVVRGDFSASETVMGLDLDRLPIVQRLSGNLTVEIVERASGRVVAKDTFWTQAEFQPSGEGETLSARGTEEWARRMAVQVAQLFEIPQ